MLFICIETGGFMAKENVKDSSADGPVVFGMTQSEIAVAADALSQQKDQNHPTETGSYQDLIKSVRKGREALFKHSGYCRKKP
jgi:hypothetical protein